MAQQDVHSLTIAGTYLGVPVAISLAYQQEELDPPLISPGRDLISSWFLVQGGPWDFIREDLSDQLTFDCAVAAWGTEVETVYLTGASGLATTPSLPSTHCVQMNIPALFPHPGASEGRFYMPGFLVAQTNRSGYSTAFNARMVLWASVLLALDGYTSTFSGAWRLVPHGKYLDAGGGTDQVHAWLPYHNPWVKVIGNRRADGCAAFTGGGAGDFDPITIPPPPP